MNKSLTYDFEHQTTEVSSNILRDKIQQWMEDVVHPATVKTYLLEHEGELLTVRHAKALTALIGHKVTVCKQYGMTCLEWTQTGGDGEPDRFSMLLAYEMINVKIPGCQWFDDHCAGMLDAAVNRNEKRQSLLDDLPNLGRLAVAINMFRRAADEVKDALKCGDWDSNPDSDRIKRLFVIP